MGRGRIREGGWWYQEPLSPTAINDTLTETKSKISVYICMLTHYDDHKFVVRSDLKRSSTASI